jgi:hypothetical protein
MFCFLFVLDRTWIVIIYLIPRWNSMAVIVKPGGTV